VAEGVFGGAGVSAAIAGTGNARTMAATAATNDPNIALASDRFMEGIHHNLPAGAGCASKE
jgi:hypothetical protein